MMAEKFKDAAQVADGDPPIEQGDSQLLGMLLLSIYTSIEWLIMVRLFVLIGSDKLRWGISRNCVVIIPPSRSSLSPLVLWDYCPRLRRRSRTRFLLVPWAWFGYGCICMLALHTWDSWLT